MYQHTQNRILDNLSYAAYLLTSVVDLSVEEVNALTKLYDLINHIRDIEVRQPSQASKERR